MVGLMVLTQTLVLVNMCKNSSSTALNAVTEQFCCRNFEQIERMRTDLVSTDLKC
jgi:hypothetical protein